MENFRDFQVGPDPFGRTWRALFKYLQTGISIRHADTVDVCFVLDSAESGEPEQQKIVALSHPELRAFSNTRYTISSACSVAASRVSP